MHSINNFYSYSCNSCATQNTTTKGQLDTIAQYAQKKAVFVLATITAFFFICFLFIYLLFFKNYIEKECETCARLAPSL